MKTYSLFASVRRLLLFVIILLAGWLPANAQIDLELSIGVDDTQYTRLVPRTFTLTLNNSGGETATNVEVSLVVPFVLSFAGVDASAGNYEPISGEWTIASLTANSSATLTLTLTPTDDSGPLTLFAQVTEADQGDNDSTPNNNTSITPAEDDETSITITPIEVDNVADMELEMNLTGAGTINVGESTTVELVAFNKGPRDAINVAIEVDLPNGFSVLSSPASIGAFNNGTWSILDFDAGNTGRLTLELQANLPQPSATVFAQFTASSIGDPDSETDNNSSSIPNEDDEAAVNITVEGEIPCDLFTPGIEVNCNDNDTPQQDDDTFSVSVNPQGTDLGNSYSVSGDINQSGLTYGSPQNLGSFPISGGALNINITDESGNCVLSNLSVNPPDPCSSGILTCNYSAVERQV
ncbi:MAG: DUF11 domain-containing protein, partial [Bacteroidota bacterium]